jgi:hypothetical protein
VRNLNYKSILSLIFGILIVIFPQYIRKYKLYERKEEITKEFITIQRITGCVIIIISIVWMLFDR